MLLANDLSASINNFASSGFTLSIFDCLLSIKAADFSKASCYCNFLGVVLIDKNTSERILEVSRFEESDRNHIFSVIDAFVAKRKIQSIL